LRWAISELYGWVNWAVGGAGLLIDVKRLSVGKEPAHFWLDEL